MAKRTIAQEIASRVIALRNCQASGNQEWELNHREALHKLEKLLPSGAGFDSGTRIDADNSDPSKAMFLLHTSYHHMDEAGGYDGWTEHAIKVTPGWFGIEVDIRGRDRNGIKDYIAEVMDHCLMSEAPESK